MWQELIRFSTFLEPRTGTLLWEISKERKRAFIPAQSPHHSWFNHFNFWNYNGERSLETLVSVLKSESSEIGLNYSWTCMAGGLMSSSLSFIPASLLPLSSLVANSAACPHSRFWVWAWTHPEPFAVAWSPFPGGCKWGVSGASHSSPPRRPEFLHHLKQSHRAHFPNPAKQNIQMWRYIMVNANIPAVLAAHCL